MRVAPIACRAIGNRGPSAKSVRASLVGPLLGNAPLRTALGSGLHTEAAEGACRHRVTVCGRDAHAGVAAPNAGLGRKYLPGEIGHFNVPKHRFTGRATPRHCYLLEVPNCLY